MRKCILSLLFLMSALGSMACTSVIISGSRTASGKPILFKNRDTDCLDNRLQWFQVGDVSFIGLVNAPVKDGEVWSGTNSLGFSIINTADYNFNEDSITADLQKKIQKAELLGQDVKPLRKELEEWQKAIKKDPALKGRKVQMDREGEIMYKALCVCATVEDFLYFLDTIQKPIGIETNFGVVDAKGGAMYVEANNWRYVTYDVNAIPEGYKVQTNYAFAGNEEDRMGVERYITACAIMQEQQKKHPTGDLGIDEQWLFTHLSRSFRHEIMGSKENTCPKSGIVVDQDYIPRRITSAAVCFEGETMWTILGYPCTGVAIPTIVGRYNMLPKETQMTTEKLTCPFSDTNMDIKMRYVFPDRVSNGKHYAHLNMIIQGDKQHKPLNQCATNADKEISALYKPIYKDWKDGKMTDEQFYSAYQNIAELFFRIYEKHFSQYLH